MIDPPLLPIMVPIAGTQNGAESGKWGRSDGEGWRDGGWVNKGVERERERDRERGGQYASNFRHCVHTEGRAAAAAFTVSGFVGI